jgi:hypothetical protein
MNPIQVRELKIRDSEPVARYGSLLLRHCRSSLSEEECACLACPCVSSPIHMCMTGLIMLCTTAVWLVHEQVAVAAMDSASLPFAASLIKAVKRRFPTASRTRRLQVRISFYFVGCRQIKRLGNQTLICIVFHHRECTLKPLGIWRWQLRSMRTR